MLKQKLTQFLENQTAFINLDSISEVFSANELSTVFGVKRNTISHYLNMLNEEKKLVKINSRPVYYFHKIAFESQFFPLKKVWYASVDEIKKECPKFEKKEDLFSILVGYDKSLSRCLGQIKTAVNYPGNGLPVLITGESGTGKSFLVDLVYRYCLENDLIKENAQLVTLNCAQYANNPDLLTSHLFGHNKGAFTGADITKKGAFESANGGVLFLDEVHRLSSEGQEKLFTYLDKGIIYPLGETDNPIPIDTRLFFATTENLESTFLTTFMRRIPIQIELPALDNRSLAERTELVYSFLINEQKKIRKPIEVSGQVITIFISGDFKGNVGELKNNVKVTIAKAYAEQKNNNTINVTVHHLSENILKKTSEIHTTTHDSIKIDKQTSLYHLSKKNSLKQEPLVLYFEKLLSIFEESMENISICENTLKIAVNQLFDLLLFETDRQSEQEMLLYLTKYVSETFNQMEYAYQINFSGNSLYAISYYLYHRRNIKWIPKDQKVISLIESFETQISNSYTMSYKYVSRILKICIPKLDIEISPIDRIILTLYLNKGEWTKREGVPKAIIIAHGYATASSIANVANRLLGKDIYESIDMPLDVTPKQIAERIIFYAENNDISNGLILLVDMGSLREIYDYFPQKILSPIVIMNNVTTQMAISVGENLQHSISLKEIVENAKESSQHEWEIIYPKSNKIKAIVTTCFTGIGTAKHISCLLEESLPSKDILKIVPYEFKKLTDDNDRLLLLSLYDVVGIIGTKDPEIINIPFLSIEDLIEGNDSKKIDDWLKFHLSENERKQFNNDIIRNFSLEKVIDSVTILDTKKIMREIEIFIKNLEIEARINLMNAQKLSLFVHVSCLVERLIRNSPIESYDRFDLSENCQKKGLVSIKKSFSVIEKNYSVKIPDSEVYYIYNIVFKKTDVKPKEEDF